MGGRLGFRRDQVRRPDGDPLAAVALGRAGSRLGAADVEGERRRRAPGTLMKNWN